MKGDGWYGFPPPKPGGGAARAVHFLSVLYTHHQVTTMVLQHVAVFAEPVILDVKQPVFDLPMSSQQGQGSIRRQVR